jgi:hypothetical protein
MSLSLSKQQLSLGVAHESTLPSNLRPPMTETNGSHKAGPILIVLSGLVLGYIEFARATAVSLQNLQGNLRHGQRSDVEHRNNCLDKAISRRRPAERLYRNGGC